MRRKKNTKQKNLNESKKRSDERNWYAFVLYSNHFCLNGKEGFNDLWIKIEILHYTSCIAWHEMFPNPNASKCPPKRTNGWKSNLIRWLCNNSIFPFPFKRVQWPCERWKQIACVLHFGKSVWFQPVATCVHVSIPFSSDCTSYILWIANNRM